MILKDLAAVYLFSALHQDPARLIPLVNQTSKNREIQLKRGVPARVTMVKLETE